jgi:hypothetical protein
MKGDFTRFTFEPTNRYNRVLKQQGRVDLDADWNEAEAIQAYLDRTRAADIIGTCGVPEENPGFEVIPSWNGLSLSRGHIYVDGLLCEVENASYRNQPYLPRPPALEPEAGRMDLVYLDVWQRHVTAIQDPSLLEEALGGADTTTRVQTVWQMKVLQGVDEGACAENPEGWPVLPPLDERGRLSTGTEPGSSSDRPCLIGPEGGYRGLENRLYRVEIHDAGYSYTWPRPEGVSATPVSEIREEGQIVVSNGQTADQPWRAGQMVELYSSETDAGGSAGRLVRLTEVNSEDNTLTLDADVSDMANHTGLRLRRVATWKWSRNNGAILFAIEQFEPGDPNQVTLRTLGQDQVLTVHPGDWVEVLGDETELKNQPGTLTAIEPHGIDRANRRLTLEADISRHKDEEAPRLRRWDQQGPALPVVAGSAHSLEDQVRVQFDAGHYITGDYWAFAARTATGRVEALDAAPPQGIEHTYCKLALIQWERVEGEGEELSLSEILGILERFNRRLPELETELRPEEEPPVHEVLLNFERHSRELSGLRRTEEELVPHEVLRDFERLNRMLPEVTNRFPELESVLDIPHWEARVLLDCRETFPSLTDICAEDVCYDNSETPELGDVDDVQEAIEALYHLRKDGCTLVLLPGTGWERGLEALEDGEDAHLCFQAGEYPLDREVVLANKGHLKVTGFGPGTRIIARQGEAALRFNNCKSVTVRDLYAEGKKTGSNQLAHLQGVLTFRDSGPVTVENVVLECAAGAVRSAACLSVFYPEPTEIEDTSNRSVTIHGSEMRVGHQQVGILLVNVERARVTNNVVRGRDRPPYLTLSQLLQNQRYRAGVRKLLIYEANLNPSDELFVGGVPEGHVLAQANRQSVLFKTDPTLVDAWDTLLEARPPRGVQTHRDLYRHLQHMADRLLLNEGQYPNLARSPRAFTRWYELLESGHGSAAAQGIVIGGTIGPDLQIRQNTIRAVRQGIHVGASAAGPRNSFYQFKRAIITDNDIDLFLPPLDLERHGIFVGNCHSLVIQNNYVNIGATRSLPVEGIRVYGFLGPMMVVRQNHLQLFTTGILVKPLNREAPSQRQWLVTDNLALSVKKATVDAPSSVTRENNIP